MKDKLYNYCVQYDRRDLIEQWDREANLPLSMYDVSIGSTRNIVWTCSKGHSWTASPYQRISRKSSCPICSGKKILSGYNDLATVRPDVAREWNKKRNKKLSPNNISPNSHTKVWWKCNKCGYEWEAVVKSRTLLNTGCPACANKVVIKGRNDLATTYPEIAASWNYPKNESLTPSDVFAGSKKKVWWICEHGHEWKTLISSRTRGTGCPICAGKQIVPGINDLKSQYPAVAAEWNYDKNIGIKPEDFSSASNESVWWKCEKGHEYYSQIAFRTISGNGCPFCSNHKLLKGFNDLGTTHPELIPEWHPTKNSGSISDYFAGTRRKAWWICPNGHEYEASIQSRALQKTGCPVCVNKIIVPDENSLEALYPNISKEWHPTKNGNVTPKDVSPGSNKKYWWICKLGHEWEATVTGRTSRHMACPYCMNKKVLVGFNDLATTHPRIAAQWHPSMNGKKTPEMFTYGSSFRAWWICEMGHEWIAPIARRAGSQQSGCPFCAGRVNYALQRHHDVILSNCKKE